MSMRTRALYNDHRLYDRMKAARQSKTEKTQSHSRRSASDELKYLQDKYEGYSFVSANYRQGMTYGSDKTVNVAISPQFLRKMANDSDLEAKYEKEIENMKSLDDQKTTRASSRGEKIISSGWAIDKDGGISSWSAKTSARNRVRGYNSGRNSALLNSFGSNKNFGIYGANGAFDYTNSISLLKAKLNMKI